MTVSANKKCCDLGAVEHRSTSDREADAGTDLQAIRTRAVRDGDLTKVSAEERQQLRDQLAQVAGGDAQKAYVKAARAKYEIQVAEDRL